MAKIVLAMATTHGPQLHTTVEQFFTDTAADAGQRWYREILKKVYSSTRFGTRTRT